MVVNAGGHGAEQNVQGVRRVASRGISIRLGWVAIPTIRPHLNGHRISRTRVERALRVAGIGDNSAFQPD